jgi:hypothetical protein
VEVEEVPQVELPAQEELVVVELEQTHHQQV